MGFGGAVLVRRHGERHNEVGEVPRLVVGGELFFKQKTACEIYQCDWSSDVCSSDLVRSRFSVYLCEINHARYVQIERRIAKAVQELAQANEEEARFFEELRDAGASSISFRSMRISQVGIASDHQSVAAFHRREVEAHCPEALH